MSKPPPRGRPIPSRMPDFIIIGAMKCATSTLHEQLARQPGVFMSTPKEPNFFSDDPEYGRGVDRYSALFAPAAADALCGESSTHYTKLPTHPHTIARMRKHLPDHCRFIYIMRHPIDRLISHYIHEWTQRVIKAPIDQAIDRQPELIDYSRYSMQLEPYLEAFGPQRVLPVMFERLLRRPQEEFERVARFIGCPSPARWDDSVSEQNVSSERMRQSPLRDAVVNLPGVAQLRRTLVPQEWRDRIKGLWMMKSRPELSASSIERLTAVFDDDLKVLGQWLGLSLSCDTFKAVARDSVLSPEWQATSRLTAA